MHPYVAEFIGTLLLLLIGNGVVASSLLKGSKGENGGWWIICFTWGMAVTFSVYAVGDFSGAHLNPAVTLALAYAGDFAWADVTGYVLAQVAGAFAASVLVWLHYLPHWRGTHDGAAKRAVFCTAPAIRNTVANLFSEIMATAVLVLGLLFLGAQDFTQGLKPIVVGMLIMVIGLSLGGTTGFAINPARDFGPRLAHAILPIHGKVSSDWGYAWIPVIGPLAGGLLAAWLYQLIY
ncbi:MAG: aquaporin family protein [Cyclobacteriaceae bacterium]|jgi:glycerol uptake facilitator protein|nr:aquaporin family protein [Cyclobacteriaceae bacterium]